MQGSAIKCVLVHRGKYLARSYLDPGSHTYEIKDKVTQLLTMGARGSIFLSRGASG